MKKILLIISLVVGVAMECSAQFKPVAIGLKLGPSVNWVSSGSTSASNDGIGLGFGLGAVVDYQFASNFAFSTGLNARLAQMHYQFSDVRVVEDFLGEVPVFVDRHVRGTYLEVPLKAKASYEVVDSWKAYVEAGLGIGVNISDNAKDSFAYHWVDYADEEYQDYSSQYRLLQASLLFGLGAEYEINPNLSLFAQLSFNHSLSNTFTHSMQKMTGSELHTNFIGIEVGFLH